MFICNPLSRNCLVFDSGMWPIIRELDSRVKEAQNKITEQGFIITLNNSFGGKEHHFR